MNKLQSQMNKSYLRIENFFIEFFKNGEMSKPEVKNLLDDYKDYILLKNGIDPKSIEIITHEGGVGQDIRYFWHPSKNVPILTDEQMKERGYNESINFSDGEMYVAKNNVYHIYLEEGYISSYILIEIDYLLQAMIAFAHEVQHIVQSCKCKGLYKHDLNQQNRILNILRNIKKNASKTSFNMVCKILERYNDMASKISTLEKYAELNSHNNLLEILEKLLNCGKFNYSDLDILCEKHDMLVQFSQSIRDDQVKLKKKYDKFIATLPKNPFVKASDLELV